MQPESRLVCQQPKRARQRDTDAHQSITTSIPRSIVASGTPLNMSPFIRGFSGQHDELDEQTGWVPAHGCSTSNHWKTATKAIGTSVAMRALRTLLPDRDQVQDLHGQLAHRETQLEHTSDQNEIFILSKKKNYLRTLVHSAAEQKTGKSREASEAEQVLVRQSAEAAQKANEVQAAMDKQQLAASLQRSELEHQQLHTANERRLQLEAQTLRTSQDLEQQALSMYQSAVRPDQVKTQWKQQISQTATYKAERLMPCTPSSRMWQRSPSYRPPFLRKGCCQVNWRHPRD